MAGGCSIYSLICKPTFLGLPDVLETDYATHGGQCVAVNGAETGLEFIVCPGGSSNAPLLGSVQVLTELIKGPGVLNAISEFTVVNAAAGNSPEIQVSSDSEPDLDFMVKPLGSGAFLVNADTGNAVIELSAPAGIIQTQAGAATVHLTIQGNTVTTPATPGGSLKLEGGVPGAGSTPGNVTLCATRGTVQLGRIAQPTVQFMGTVVGDITSAGALSLGTDLTVTGDTELDGVVKLGDSASDAVWITGTVVTNLTFNVTATISPADQVVDGSDISLLGGRGGALFDAGNAIVDSGATGDNGEVQIGTNNAAIIKIGFASLTQSVRFDGHIVSSLSFYPGAGPYTISPADNPLGAGDDMTFLSGGTGGLAAASGDAYFGSNDAGSFTGVPGDVHVQVGSGGGAGVPDIFIGTANKSNITIGLSTLYATLIKTDLGVQGKITTHLVPKADSTLDLGTTDLLWRFVYSDQLGTQQGSTAAVALGVKGAPTTGLHFNSTTNNVALCANATNVVHVRYSGAGQLGLYGATPVSQIDITGVRAGGSALTDLITKLATTGLLTDSTTP